VYVAEYGEVCATTLKKREKY